MFSAVLSSEALSERINQRGGEIISGSISELGAVVNGGPAAELGTQKQAVRGTAGHDFLYTQRSAGRLLGLGGDDWLAVLSDETTQTKRVGVSGGTGDDRIYAMSGLADVDGGPGYDVLFIGDADVQYRNIEEVWVRQASGEEWLRQEGEPAGSVKAKPNPPSSSPGASATPFKPKTAIGKPTDLSDLDTSTDIRARISFDATRDLSAQEPASAELSLTLDGLSDGTGGLDGGGLFAAASTSAAAAPTVDLAGDVNGDGVVDGHDIDAVRAAYQADVEPGQDPDPYTPEADLFSFGDSLGKVDEHDFNFLFHGLLGARTGDGDFSGQVEQGDLNLVLNNWGRLNVGWTRGDFNNSGQVEQGDLNFVLNNWGHSSNVPHVEEGTFDEIGAKYYFGFNADDTITGTSGDDFIWGGGGNDTINAGDGDDLIYGGAGSDAINPGGGNDTIIDPDDATYPDIGTGDLTITPQLSVIEETANAPATDVAVLEASRPGPPLAATDFQLSGADAERFQVVQLDGAPQGQFVLRLRGGQDIAFAETPILNVTVALTDLTSTPDTVAHSVAVQRATAASPIADAGLRAAVRASLGIIDPDYVLTNADLGRVTELYGDPTAIGWLNEIDKLANLQQIRLVPTDFAQRATTPQNLLTIDRSAGNSELTHVQVQGAGLDDAALTTLIQNLPDGVEVLDLLYNDVANLPTDLLTQLPNLRELRLHGNAIADRALQYVNRDPVDPLNDPTLAVSTNPLAVLSGSLVQLDLASASPDLAVYADDPVADLARRLYYLPTRMYEWVRNHVELDIYHGFMRGAQATLETRRGNDFDTALLLKELLEEAGFTYNTDLHMRFRKVTAQQSDVMRWLGVANTTAMTEALKAMSPAYNDPALNGDQVTFTHAFLEIDAGGQTFQLDPSWKYKNLPDAPSDFIRDLQDNTSNFRFEVFDIDGTKDTDGDGDLDNDGFLDQVRIENAAEFYADRVRDYLSVHHPDLTLADVAYDGPIVPEVIDDLTLTTPGWTEVSGVAGDITLYAPATFGNLFDIDAETVLDQFIVNGTAWVNAHDTPSDSHFAPASLTHVIAIDIYSGTDNFKPNYYGTVNQDFYYLPVSEFLNHQWTVRTVYHYASDPDLGSIDEYYTSLLRDGIAIGEGYARNANAGNAPSGFRFRVYSYAPNVNVVRASDVARDLHDVINIGVDAGQESQYSFANRRAAYTEAVIEALDGRSTAISSRSDLSDHEIAIVGGLTDLVQSEYARKTREAERALMGLAGFVDTMSAVGVGTVTARLENGYQQNASIQSTILPAELLVDQPGGSWPTKYIGLADVPNPLVFDLSEDLSNEPPVVRGLADALGWVNSGLEHEVIEDITNTPAGSTARVIQMVAAQTNPSGTDIFLADSNNYEDLYQYKNVGSNLSPLEQRFNDGIDIVIDQFKKYDPSAREPTANQSVFERIEAIVPLDTVRVEGADGSYWEGYAFHYFNPLATEASYAILGEAVNAQGGRSGGNAFFEIPPATVQRVDQIQPTLIGDPVDPVDGHVYHTQTDVSLPNLGVPLTFTRTYKSNQVGANAGDLYFDSDRGLGVGWSYSFSDRLEFVGTVLGRSGGVHYNDDASHPVLGADNSIIWYTGDGARHLFKQAGTISDPVYGTRHYYESETIYGRLASLDDYTFRFVDPDGMSYRFDIAGKLTEVADGFGHGVEVTYGVDQRISAVTSNGADGEDRKLTFTWDANGLDISDNSADGGLQDRTWRFRLGTIAGEKVLTEVTARGGTGQGTDDERTHYKYYSDDVRRYLLNEVQAGLRGTPSTLNTTDLARTTYEYYANRRAMRVHLPDGRQEQFWYRFGLYEADNDLANRVSYADDFAGAQTTFVDGSGDVVTYSLAESGEILRETFSDGTYHEAEWNDRGQRVSVTDAFGNTESFGYDDALTIFGGANDDFISGVLLKHTDAYGAVTDYYYGAYRTADLGPYHRQLRYVPEEGGNFILMPLVRILERGVAGDQRRDTKFDHEYWNGSSFFDDADDAVGATVNIPDGQPANLAYRLKRRVDAEGNETTYQYNTTAGTPAEVDSLPTRIDAPGFSDAGVELSQGARTELIYNAAGQVVAEKRSEDGTGNGLVTRYDYNSRGELITQISPNGVAEEAGLSFAAGALTSSGYDDVATRFAFDGFGRLVTTQGPKPDGELAQPFTRVEYDGRGNALAVHVHDDGGLSSPDSDGRLVTQTTYDDQSRVTKVLYADGTESRFTYDGVGRQTSATDELGRTTRFFYDRRGRRSAAISPDGSVTRQRTDGGGRVVAVTDARGHTTTFRHDELGRVVEQTDPAPVDGSAAQGGTTKWDYDGHGDLRSVTDQRNHQTLYRYDGFGRLIETTQKIDSGDDLITTTEYDPRGNVVRVTDPKNHTTTYGYDFADRRIETTTPDPDGSGGALSALTTRFLYDDNGNLTHTVVDPEATTGATLTPLTLGTLPGGDDVAITQIDYDRLDRAWKTTAADPDGSGPDARPEAETVYDNLGRVHATIDANGNRTEFLYDDRGRVVQTTRADDDLDQTTLTQFDAAGQIVATADALGHVYRNDYDANGRVTRETAPDPDGAGLQSASHTHYGYDAAGNLAWITEPRGDGPEDFEHTTRFTYDEQNRLILTVGPDPDDPEDPAEPKGPLPAPTRSSTYDLAGNLETTTDELGRTTRFEYDELNRVELEVAPDPDGAGALTSPETSYVYDANGNLASVTDPNGNTTYFYYDAWDRLTHTVNALAEAAGQTIDSDGNGIGDAAPDAASLSPYVVQTIYDDRGRAVLSIDELGREHGTVYDNLDRVVATLAPDPANGKAFESHADARDGIIPVPAATTDPRITTYTYDDAGNLLSVKDPLGRTRYTQYDGLHRPTHTVNAAAPASAVDSDGDGRLDGPIDTLNNGGVLNDYLTTTAYDAQGRVVLVVDELGREYGTVYDAQGRVTAQVDPHQVTGRAFHTPDDAGRADRIVGLATRFTYDRNGNLTAVTDPLGNATWTVYDRFNRPVREINALAGDDVTDDNGEVKAEFTAPAFDKYSVQTFYDAAGQPVLTVDERGRQYGTVYDNLGRVIADVAPQGGDLINIQPDAGKAFSDGAVNNAGPSPALADVVGRATRYAYDANGNLVGTADAEGRRNYTYYDALNRPIHQINGDGAGLADGDAPGADGYLIPDAAYNGTNLGDYTVTLTYDAAGQIVLTTDELGREYGTVYDHAGRVLADVAPYVNLADPNDPNNGRAFAAGTDTLTGLTLDPADLATAAAVVGRTTRYTYDDADQRRSTTDALGHTAWSFYDDLGRLTHTVDQIGDAWVDPNDDQATAWAPGQPLPAGADGNGHPDYTVVRAYDSVGRLTSYTGPNGHTTAYTYDRADRQTAVIDPLGYADTYAYDDAGNLIQTTDRNGDRTEYRYDDLYRRIAEQWETVLPNNGHTLILGGIGYSYYDDGQIDEVKEYVTPVSTNAGAFHTFKHLYDAAGRLWWIRETDATIASGSDLGYFFYAYDDTDRLVWMQDPENVIFGDHHTRFEYDDQGRIDQIFQTAPHSKSVDYTYNLAGQLELTEYGTVFPTLGTDFRYTHSTQNTYDPAGRLFGNTHFHQPTGGSLAGLAQYIYERDALDRPEAFTQFDYLATRTTNYDYDPTGQILDADINATGTGVTADETYTYDGAGNRLSDNGQAVTPDAQSNRLDADADYTYTYDRAGQLTERRRVGDGTLDRVFTYDHRGRLTQVLDYGLDGSTVEQTVRYTYDAFDRLIERRHTDASGITDSPRYLYHGDQRWLAVETPTSAPEDPATRYLYAPGSDTPLSVDPSQLIEPHGFWLLADAAGTVRDVVGTSTTQAQAAAPPALYYHVEFSQFGEVLSHSYPDASGTPLVTPPATLEWISPGGLSFGFQGRTQDAATGLVHHNARWSDPESGRFLSEDPSGFVFGDPNLYRYLGNAPTVWSDPTGLGNVNQAAAGTSLFDLSSFPTITSNTSDAGGLDLVLSNHSQPARSGSLYDTLALSNDLNQASGNFNPGLPLHNPFAVRPMDLIPTTRPGHLPFTELGPTTIRGALAAEFRLNEQIIRHNLGHDSSLTPVSDTVIPAASAVYDFAAPRVGSTLQAGFGVAETIAGVSLTLGGGPFGGFVAGPLLTFNGLDNTQAGLRGMFAGRPADTRLHGGLETTAVSLGATPQTADQLANIGEFTLGLGFGVPGIVEGLTQQGARQITRNVPTIVNRTPDAFLPNRIGPGAANQFDEAFASNRHFSVADTALKHGRTARAGRGGISPAPTRGQFALDNSVQISPNSPRRIGVDPDNNEIVILDRTGNTIRDGHVIGGSFHGHVRSWDQLSTAQRNALQRLGVSVSRSGEIHFNPYIVWNTTNQ
ncbi:MAG: RHS repeat-associated core domain-containing protein [Planctomycetota bacterium]